MTVYCIRLAVGVAAGVLCLSAIACGGSGNSTAVPISATAAKRPFVERGFTIGCPNLEPQPKGLIHVLGINASGKSACQPNNLGGLDIYRDAATASKACAPSKSYFCGSPVYRVRNIVLYIDPSDSAATRRRLLQALRVLGTPTRIA